MDDCTLLQQAMQDERIARQVAYILGPNCAAQQAINAAEESRAEGIPAAVVRAVDRGRQYWLCVRAAAAMAKE